MIRRVIQLTPAERELVKPLAEEFFRESRSPGKLCLDHLFGVISLMMSQGKIGMFFLERDGRPIGVSVGLLGQHLMTGEVMVSELVWYVQEPHRGSLVSLHLFRALESWAIMCGATILIAGYHAGLMEEALSQFYLSRGFIRMETIFQKSLCLKQFQP